MDRFFVKVRDLTDDVEDVFGPPDVKGKGSRAIHDRSIENRHGIIVLGGCWHTGTGDHIDRWNRHLLQIESGESTSAVAHHAFIRRSREVWFWRVDPIRPTPR